MLHNAIFSPFTPRIRVIIALFLMSLSMLTLFMTYWWLKSKLVIWVYICYLFGGIGIGSFESNILATITPLGHDTKLWAMMGIPLGFVTITVGGFGFMSITHLDVEYIYLTVFFCCFISIFLWLLRIPIPKSYDHQQSFKQFINHLICWKQWFKLIKLHCFVLMIDMFCLSFNTAINQYIYDSHSFPIFGGLLFPHKFMVEENLFFCLLNLSQFIGDLSGRKLIYYFKISCNPSYFLILSFIGIIGCMTKIPIIALFSTLLVTFSNGLIYSSSTYFIDNNTNHHQYLLTSLSIWLFIGDIGSITGSNVWQFIVPIVCKYNLTSSQSQYFCSTK